MLNHLNATTKCVGIDFPTRLFGELCTIMGTKSSGRVTTHHSEKKPICSSAENNPI